MGEPQGCFSPLPQCAYISRLYLVVLAVVPPLGGWGGLPCCLGITFLVLDDIRSDTESETWDEAVSTRLGPVRVLPWFRVNDEVIAPLGGLGGPASLSRC